MSAGAKTVGAETCRRSDVAVDIEMRESTTGGGFGGNGTKRHRRRVGGVISSVLPPGPSVDVDLVALWEQVRTHLDHGDSADLGAVRAGVSDIDHKPWAQTNDGEDRVNLTLELKTDQLELDLVGWKQGQAEALKAWLQTGRGESTVNSLPGYEIVAFERRAYKKTKESKPWWQDETYKELGTCPAERFNAGWTVRMRMEIKDRSEEAKFALHLRRAWLRDGSIAITSGLIADEVRRLLPILRDIWSA
jgi:hypothetical protein